MMIFLQPAPEPAPEPLVCIACGARHEAGRAWCEKCGEVLP